MNEVAKDREGAGLRLLEGQRNGIADAKAHAEMLRADDVHETLGYGILYKQVNFAMQRITRARSAVKPSRLWPREVLLQLTATRGSSFSHSRVRGRPLGMWETRRRDVQAAVGAVWTSTVRTVHGLSRRL